MMNEEEKKNELPVEEEIDEDFADAALPTPEPEEGETAPEQPEEPAEELVEQAPEEPEPPAIEEQFSSEYDDPRLERIENARIIWNKAYKKTSRIKFFVSITILIVILTAWLIPTILIRDRGLFPLYIGLGAAVAGVVGLLILNYTLRRGDKVKIQAYFQEYFAAINEYTLGDLGAKNIEGSVDSKITKEEFLEGKAFDQAATVGSRDNIVFTYNDMECAMAEAAAQVDGGKALQTIFVGKYLRTHNSVEVSDPEGLLLYFMGNERALPPAKMNQLHLCENGSRYRVYGSSADKKVLTKKVRDALAKIRTDKLLVDVCVVIQTGRTYWYLGYEDDIMVLPNDKPFDPRFVKKYKEQIALILDAALALN